jgi:peptidoglycan hydrolase CwlO-like protein
VATLALLALSQNCNKEKSEIVEHPIPENVSLNGQSHRRGIDMASKQVETRKKTLKKQIKKLKAELRELKSKSAADKKKKSPKKESAKAKKPKAEAAAAPKPAAPLKAGPPAVKKPSARMMPARAGAKISAPAAKESMLSSVRISGA